MLASQLARGTVRWTASRRSVEIADKSTDSSSERCRNFKSDLGNLAHLACLAVPATATVVVFFGLGFSLIGSFSRQGNADPNDPGHRVAGESRGSDLGASRADTATMFAVTAAVPPAQPPTTHDDPLPPASKPQAQGPLSISAVSAAPEASDVAPPPEPPALRSNSNQASPATPSRVIHAKRAKIARYRYLQARTHLAGTPRPEPIRYPPSPNGPEKALRWIAQAATNFFAALAPPPPPPAAAARTRLARSQ
jgi:hypothetical protein